MLVIYSHYDHKFIISHSHSWLESIPMDRDAVIPGDRKCLRVQPILQMEQPVCYKILDGLITVTDLQLS